MQTMNGFRALKGNGLSQLHTLKGTVDTAGIRSETFEGREYVAVPVVALVEGVLQGLNADQPEFAPASAFGKFPSAWNGRPVVMNHPLDADGTPVPAGSPDILQEWSFGRIFNTKLDGKKLKTEAWIDVATAKKKGGDFSQTLKRLQDGKMVEVSVGTFVEVLEKAGTYQGKKYGAIWIESVPDHLALLPEGVKGACSNEAGCGAPRSNQAKDTPMPQKVTITDQRVHATQETPCECEDKTKCSCHPHDEPHVDSTREDSAADEHDFLFSGAARAIHHSLNAVPNNRLNQDVGRAIAQALRTHIKGDYCMLVGYTPDTAVYESLNTGKVYQIGINVSSDLKVEFKGEAKEVKLAMEIISVNASKETPMSTENAKPGSEAKPTVASTPAGTQAAPATEAPAQATPTLPAAPSPEVKAAAAAPTPSQAAAAAPEAKPRSLQEYIADAPAEYQEVISEGVRMHTERKNAAIKSLMDTGRCAFSEAELKAMSMNQIDKLTALAQIPVQPAAPSYVGQSVPRVEANTGGFADDPPAWDFGKPTAPAATH